MLPKLLIAKTLFDHSISEIGEDFAAYSNREGEAGKCGISA